MNDADRTRRRGGDASTATSAAVDLYWIPLGAGSRVVQASGRMFEAVAAWRAHRPRHDLYHAALEVYVPRGRFAVEQAPVPDGHGEDRGVVAVGPVGMRAAGRLRVFRYEVRCWLDGIIPDLGAAVDSPIRLTTDEGDALRVLESLPSIPTPVWGRDEAGVGEMWNSNSVISWVLTRSGLDVDVLAPPVGGHAPGWAAGRAVASSADGQSRGMSTRAPDAGSSTGLSFATTPPQISTDPDAPMTPTRKHR